jgi:hypothetical protein
MFLGFCVMTDELADVLMGIVQPSYVNIHFCENLKCLREKFFRELFVADESNQVEAVSHELTTSLK